MNDIYENNEECNPCKKRKKLIAFDEINADILNNNNLNLIVTDLFISGRKYHIPTTLYSFLVDDGTLASDNHLRFRINLLERISKLIMEIDEKIRDEKLKYNINREAAKIHPYHQVKLMIKNILKRKKYHLNKVE